MTDRLTCDVVIPDGWRFYTCDASIEGQFSVRLARDEAGLKWWHSHTEEQQELIPLYSGGTSTNLHDAVNNAVCNIGDSL